MQIGSKLEYIVANPTFLELIIADSTRLPFEHSGFSSQLLPSIYLYEHH